MPAEGDRTNQVGTCPTIERPVLSSFIPSFAVSCSMTYAQAWFIPAKMKQGHQQPPQQHDSWVEAEEVIQPPASKPKAWFGWAWKRNPWSHLLFFFDFSLFSPEQSDTSYFGRQLSLSILWIALCSVLPSHLTRPRVRSDPHRLYHHLFVYNACCKQQVCKVLSAEVNSR